MMRREMPLNASGILIRLAIQEFIGTRQQIADIITLRPLEYQEQEHIYWEIIEYNLQ
jgi:hypothetical protein